MGCGVYMVPNQSFCNIRSSLSVMNAGCTSKYSTKLCVTTPYPFPTGTT